MKDTSQTFTQTNNELPHLWQKPSYTELLTCLEGLRVQLCVWNPRKQRQTSKTAPTYDRREVISFLSSLISSPLAWLSSDEEREVIWDQASKRMAERCGRTAMGEITRHWPFSDPITGEELTLSIREPPITGDALGLKTWGSSYALAQLLPTFSSPGGPLSHLFPSPHHPSPSVSEILELGSGTGLLGLAASLLWRARVALSDLPDILPNLQHNADLNTQLLTSRGGSIRVAPLTWGVTDPDRPADTDPSFVRRLHTYRLILVADPLYDDDHPALLARAIDEQLARDDAGARALVMVPRRDETTGRLLGELRRLLAGKGVPIRCLVEDEVEGRDDWGGKPGNEEDEEEEEEVGEEGGRRVGFWWGVFGRERGLEMEESRQVA